MSKVIKAHQLTISGFWRPQPRERLQEHKTKVPDWTQRQQEIEEYLQAAQAQAAQILAEAQAQADAILAQADAELARQQEIGYQAGFEAGLAAGQEQGKATWQAKLAELKQLRQELVAKDAKLLQEAEQEALTLALAIAQRVINYKLTHDDQVLQAALRQVLSLAKGCREALLLVSEADFPALWERRTQWQNLLPGVKEFDLQVDATLSKGDLVLETNQGIIDARVDTILERVADEFGLGELA